MPLRRAGTVPNAALRYGPGSAAHRSAKSYALRCVRGTGRVFTAAIFTSFCGTFELAIGGHGAKGRLCPRYDCFATCFTAAIFLPSFCSAARTFRNSCSVAAFTFGYCRPSRSSALTMVELITTRANHL